MSVIVTNARSRIAYNVVRSLGQKGVEIYTADFVPRSMSFFSRYSKGHFLYPSPFTDQEGFIQRLIHEIQRLRASVLIPVYEETFLVAKHADRLSKYVSIVVPQYDGILIAHNKDKWNQIARNLKIPVPESCSIEELHSGIVKASDLRYPVLVKPKQGGGGWGIKRVASPEALTAMLNAESCNGVSWSRFFVQEWTSGETHCVAMLFNRGKLRAKVAYKQLRDYPLAGGQATMRVSVRSAKAEAYLQELLEHLNWHGVCQADFVLDAATQTPYLIDMNPRLWGSLVQAIASGVDFPHLLYRLAREGDVTPITEFKTGVITRWVGGELGAFLPHLKNSTEKRKFLRAFFFPPTAASLYDDLTIVDPLPFFAWVTGTLLKSSKFRAFRAADRESLKGIWE